MLSLKNIHAGYNGREILRGIDLYINQGEIVAILGANGAGKSTILKVISGFIFPTNGNIIFNGKDITKLETSTRISLGMGYFLQGGQVFADMSVYENLQIGGDKLKESIFLERIDEVIKLFPALEEKFNKRAGLLSGGERQMLSLGMIILRRPKLLLLDEPSAGLAPGLVKGMMDKIVEINKSYGSAILLIEQNVNEALHLVEKSSGKCYLLGNGTVSFEGKSEEIREVIIKGDDHSNCKLQSGEVSNC